jgi:hypothetical protein
MPSQFFFSVAAASNPQVCDLDQMANNVNPGWLTNCFRSPNCTQLTCQAIGDLGNFFSTIVVTDMSCLTLPAVRMAFIQGDGEVGSDILVTQPQVVTSRNRAIGGVLSIVVLAQSTVGHSVNITVKNS